MIYEINHIWTVEMKIFHFISTVHIWFISYIINTHFFHGNIWTHNWPAPNVSGFIAQLVEHRTGIARSRVHTPLKFWIFFFQASLLNCINCVHCDDHLFIFKPSFVISNFQNIKIIFWCSSKNIFTDLLSESCLKTKQKTPTAFKKGTTC